MLFLSKRDYIIIKRLSYLGISDYAGYPRSWKAKETAGQQQMENSDLE